MTYGVPQQIDDSQGVGKVDFQLTANHSVFGRYMATTYDIPPAYRLAPDNVLTTTNAGFDNLAQSVALGDTLILGNNTVNAARVTVNRTAIARVHQPSFNAPSVGANVHSALPDFMVLGVTGGFNIGGNTQSLATFVTNSYQVSDDLNLVRGNHQFAVGGNIAFWTVDQFAVNQDTGNFTFNGQATGLGLADFMLGRVSSFQQGSPTDWATKQVYLGAYAQDAWRVSPRLTLNYGVRWEPSFRSILPHGKVYVFDAQRFRQGTRSTVVRGPPRACTTLANPAFRTARRSTRDGPSSARAGVRVGRERRRPHVGTRLLRHCVRLRRGAEPGQRRQRAAARVPRPVDESGRWPGQPVAGHCGRQPVPVRPGSRPRGVRPVREFSARQRIRHGAAAGHSWNLSLQRQLSTT